MMIGKKIALAAFVVSLCLNGYAAKTSGQYFDDATLSTKIVAKLISKRNIPYLKITTHVYKRNVALCGFIPKESEIKSTLRAVQSTEGVQTVYNYLIPYSQVAQNLKTTVGRKLDDGVLTSTIKSKFFADNRVPANAISIDTYRGVVELCGFVENQRQANAAGQIASNTEGVVGVINNIMLDSQVK